jgi:peptide/nickel transport system ATP-binding protein
MQTLNPKSSTDQAMADTIVEIKDLRKIYQDQRSLFGKSAPDLVAIDGVSLDIKKGQVFGLVGASGSGKTTIGRLILKLENIDGGIIKFQGKNISRLKGSELKAFRRKVQLIPQDPYQSLNPYMSVFDTVAEPLIIHNAGDSKTRREKVAHALTTAGLTPADDFFFRYPHQLSGGQRQRAAIARAMVLGPEFIIADEPTSMLDATISFTIFQLLADISRQKDVTLLFITHDLAAARFLCDRIAVIYKGKIVETGIAKDLITNPQSDYTKALINAQPKFSFIKKKGGQYI